MRKYFYALAIISIAFASCTSPATDEEELNDTPNALNDSASTDVGISINIHVLNNDNFGDDGPSTGAISVISNTTENGGTVSVNTAGTPNDPTDDTIDYTPEANFDGTDTFDYTITDSDGDSDTASVTVVVIPPTGPEVGTTFTIGDLKYVITNSDTKEVSIEKTTEDGPSGALDLPATIDQFDLTYNVTSIADEGFAYSYNLTSVTIPESITSIGQLAFYDSSRITSIDVPDTVSNIEHTAFGQCKSLTSINIPAATDNLAENVFFGCESLTSITIPSTITSIGNSAFYYCSSLNNVTIPDSVANEDMGTAIFGY